MARMISHAQQQEHVDWLKQLTAIPTAAGREHRVIEWIERWSATREDITLRRDQAGNLVLTQTGRDAAQEKDIRPLFITAHLDHPAFVVREVIDRQFIELEFRGGVQDAYFVGARIDIFDHDDHVTRASIESLDANAKPFKRVRAKRTRAGGNVTPGDVGRWAFRARRALPEIRDDRLYTHACDDLAAVAAALATLDLARELEGLGHVGVLLTRAEEVGFIGAIAACKLETVPRDARLICLENSRSFSDSPIGAGPILRVGDRLTVFEPRLTNRLGAILMDYQQRHPAFTWQRKLMPGGACEATAFASFGHESTCICLPLGNYHNMCDIDGVVAGKRPARVGPEFISISDYHGMIEMLLICARELDTATIETFDARMERLLKTNGHVLDAS